MTDLQKSTVTKHSTLGLFLGWLFALIFGVAGVVALFQSGQFITGVFLILAALVALPPAQTFLKKKASISIGGVFRTALVIVFCFISIAMLPSENGALANNTDTTTDDAYTTVAGQTVICSSINILGIFTLRLMVNRLLLPMMRKQTRNNIKPYTTTRHLRLCLPRTRAMGTRSRSLKIPPLTDRFRINDAQAEQGFGY